MNFLTVNNEKIIGYNAYQFLKYYKKLNIYTVDETNYGDLIVYEQFFPNQMLQAILYNKNIKIVSELFDQSINFIYNNSLNKRINKIYFFYPFTFYSKYDYDFDIISLLKNKIEKRFSREVIFILNNYFEDDDYKHFSAFRYDIFSKFREHIKIKNNNIRNKIFLSLNAKIRKHRDDLLFYLQENNLLKYFYFSYTEKNINLWKTENYSVFGQKYLNNENQSGHLAFEYYLNDDFYNLKNSHFFDMSYYYIITETNADDCLCFISEKTYKAFYHQIPFLVLGNPFTIKNLKKEGFKTFNNWIDESYDEETNYEKRKTKIFNEIKRLSCLSINEHENNIKEMKDILEYNLKHLLDISNFKLDFLKIF